ncbi:MAG: hypothetical protein R2762_24920 [Bryobacteraceae bacterium]
MEAQAPARTRLTRAEAARINGAKSRGPKTSEGKARSAQNARKHGVFAKDFHLPNSSHPEFPLILRRYLAETAQPSAGATKDSPGHGPAPGEDFASVTERRRIHRLALLDLQLHYCWAVQTAILQDALDAIVPDHPALDPVTCKALAFGMVHAAMDRLSRIEFRIHRAFCRAAATGVEQKSGRTNPKAAAPPGTKSKTEQTNPTALPHAGPPNAGMKNGSNEPNGNAGERSVRQQPATPSPSSKSAPGTETCAPAPMSGASHTPDRSRSRPFRRHLPGLRLQCSMPATPLSPF